MTIHIAIVTHPARRKWAHQLSKQTGGRIVLDSLYLGAKANHLQAWQYLAGLPSEQTDWGVVIEDDVTLCEDFADNLASAIEHAPGPVLSLYLGRGRPPRYQERIASAITQQVSFITADVLFSAQGYALPLSWFNVKVIEQIADIDLPIDEAITHWVRSWCGKVAYPRYSLVDHRDGPTLIDDHGDGQPRNGTTALCVENCDPSGARLPEIRKAWLMAGHNTPWDLGSIPLPEGETP